MSDGAVLVGKNLGERARNPKLRIAVIGNIATALGNFRGPLIEDIIARGHEVTALAPDFDTDSERQVLDFGAQPVTYPLSRTGLNPWSDFTDALTLRRILRDIAPDVVLSFGIKPVIYGTLVARTCRVPARHALITGLGYAFTDGGRTNFKRRMISHVARCLYRLSLRYADRVFVQNPDDAEELVRQRIAAPGKIVTVNGTGVKLQDWPAAPPVTRPPTFTLVARLIADKGIREFVEAARAIKVNHPEVRFLLLGGTDPNPEGIGNPEIRSWVDEGLVEWPGHVAVQPWLEQTSVFVLPSYYREGVPRSTQEAMAMGRPVITTDAPGCRETVVHGQNGFLVPPRDVPALVDAMQNFVDNPDLIAQMGRKSRKLAEQRFDVRSINRVMITSMGL